jgi:hypothetical protein
MQPKKVWVQKQFLSKIKKSKNRLPQLYNVHGFTFIIVKQRLEHLPFFKLTVGKFLKVLVVLSSRDDLNLINKPLIGCGVVKTGCVESIRCSFNFSKRKLALGLSFTVFSSP